MGEQRAGLDIVLGERRRVGLDDDHVRQQPNVHQERHAAARGVTVSLLLVQIMLASSALACALPSSRVDVSESHVQGGGVIVVRLSLILMYTVSSKIN